jgi:hypothetical protein
LEEPYQEAVLLRYYEGLSPKEIAARTSAPIATVRSRLQRALDQLRSRLDRESGGDRATWVTALAPFLGAGKFGSVGSAGGLAACSGAVVMGVTAKITVGVVATACVGALGWWGVEVIRGPERAEETNDPVGRPVLAQASEVDVENLTQREPVDPLEEADPAADDLASQTGTLIEPLSEEEELAKLYADWTVEELERESEAICDEVGKAADPILQQRMDAGIYEVLGYGNEYSPPEGEDVWVLRSLCFAPTSRGTEIRRVELLDQECPELYAKLRKARWLRAEANRKRAAAVEGKTNGR